MAAGNRFHAQCHVVWQSRPTQDNVSMNPWRDGEHRKAFTLVELLVVIGIISVLISILLPALGRARQHANTIRCASNLRAFAQGWHLYANANLGTCVPGRLPTSGAPNGVYD